MIFLKVFSLSGYIVSQTDGVAKVLIKMNLNL
jgi:hypothetical protein